MKVTSKPLFILAAILVVSGLFMLGAIIGYNANPNRPNDGTAYLPIGLLLLSLGLLCGVIANRKKSGGIKK
jgi:peptidoglycan/LPS O-acetylase OafA/YrhL